MNYPYPRIRSERVEQRLQEKKKSKYHNKKTVIDSIKFDSKKEAKRYEELLLLEQSHQIENLELQKEFVLQEAFVNVEGEKRRAIKYVADFVYFDLRTNKTVVEDVKSKATRTQVYMIKKKLFESRYQTVITEV